MFFIKMTINFYLSCRKKKKVVIIICFVFVTINLVQLSITSGNISVTARYSHEAALHELGGHQVEHLQHYPHGGPAGRDIRGRGSNGRIPAYAFTITYLRQIFSHQK